MKLDGVRFVNFDESGCVVIGIVRIIGICFFLCGGFFYYIQNFKFVNVSNKGRYVWLWEFVIKDIDGTLVGEIGDFVLIVVNVGKIVILILDILFLNFICVFFFKFSINVVVSVCDLSVKFYRFVFNNIFFSFIKFKDVIFINRFGNVTNFYRKKVIIYF